MFKCQTRMIFTLICGYYNFFFHNPEASPSSFTINPLFGAVDWNSVQQLSWLTSHHENPFCQMSFIFHILQIVLKVQRILGDA